MSEVDYQLEKDNENYTSSKVGCISPRAKIILAVSIMAVFIIILVLIILIVTLKKDSEIAPDIDYSNFVIINDIIPDIITELRYYSSFNFVGEHIDGYEEPVALLTKEAAEKLKKASDKLDSMEYRIKIWDSYRPQRAVDHFMRWGKNESDAKMKKYFYPDLTKKEVFEKGYVSTRSGHSRGSTLDITLIHKENGTDVDFGSCFDYFGDKAHYNYTEISPEQKKNRELLKKIMEENDFIALPEEWWHFTLKNEPYPNTYFNFPVNSTLIRRGIKK